MKRFGHLNRDISRVLARLGHTDCIAIADCGLPVPEGIECIDVSLKLGQPGFMDVLESVLADMVVERAFFAWEIRNQNDSVAIRAAELAREGVQVEYVTHERLKELTRDVRAIIRTGEATPYANVLLYSAVLFNTETTTTPGNTP